MGEPRSFRWINRL